MRVLTLLVAISVLAGCAHSGFFRQHDRLRVVQTQDFPSLDPVFVSGVGGQELASLLYSYLVKIDDRGRVVPDAAEAVPSVENGGISADGRTLTYHLRRGLRFSDGSPLRSFDVAETIARIAFPGSDVPTRVAYDDVAAVSTPDEYTVRVFLRRPYAPIVLYLCGPANATPIFPRKLIAGRAHLRGTRLDDGPVGSGPYVVRRWIRGDRLELAANEHYNGPIPAIRSLTIRIVGSANGALQMLRTGEADAYVNADDAQYDELRALPGMRTDLERIDGTGALIFNTQDPRLRDAAVRRAIVAAIDVPTVVQKSLLGPSRAIAPGRGLFQWAYDPRAYAMPPFNARAANAALDRAGWRRGADGLRRRNGETLAVDLLVRSDKPSAVVMATQMQAYLRAVGVAMSIQRISIMEYVAPDGPLYGGRFQLALFPFVAGFDPDVRDQFGCDRIPPRGFNKPRYCSARLDRMMNAAVERYDRATRARLYLGVERQLAADLPMAALYQAVSINAFPDGLQRRPGAVTSPFWDAAAWTY